MAAYVTTYDDLVADIIDICENDLDEFVTQIPKIIARAQDNLQRDLGLSLWNVTEPASTVNGQGYITRPDDWLDIRGIHVTTPYSPLEQRTRDWVRAYGSATGTPKYWAPFGTNIYLAPTPNAVLSLDVDLIGRLPALAEDNQTNWLTLNAADLLLLGSLIGAQYYLVSKERVAEFGALYQSILTAAQKELRSQERTGYEPTREASRPSIMAGTRS